MAESEPLTEEQRVKQFWSRVPYHDFAREVAPAAADLVEFVDVGEDEAVLDVGCGTGNTSITAARRGADVTGVDLNPDMLEWAEENAAVIDADIDFRKGDATDLSIPDHAYDVTLSTFGHHLASDPVAATEELVRVTRPGGRVGFAAYALDGAVGDAYRALAQHHPEGDMVVKPFYWGDEDFVRDQFGPFFAALEFDRGTVEMHGLSPQHLVDYCLDISGALRTAFEQTTDQEAVYEQFVDIASDYFEDNTYTIEYVLVRGQVHPM